jgi:hypothetical protein
VQRVGVTGPSLPPGRFPSTGTHLGQRLGTKYFAIGTAYGGPARNEPVPAADSVDAILGTVRATPFLLNLRGAKDPWLSVERPMRFQVGNLMLPLGPAFDAIAYFDRTEPAPRVK